jgi:hypothetical protein
VALNILATTAVTVFVPFTVFQISTAGAAGKAPQQDQPGAFTIQSWIHADLTDNGLSGTDSDCFRVSGAIVEQGGEPTWTNDAEFSAPTQATGSTAVTAASKECGDAVPAGGIVLVPPPEAGQYALAQYKLTAFYVNFTVHGQKGPGKPHPHLAQPDHPARGRPGSPTGEDARRAPR